MKNIKSKWGINLKKTNCPNCGKTQPKFRIPKGIKEVMWGGWTCQNCGCKIDKYGQRIINK